MSSADTIFALATPPGRSGVAVVRLSGSKALPALKQLSRLAGITPRTAYYTSFHSPGSNEVIDQGLALYFKAPHSFTGEDVVELQLHGSLAVIREILDHLGSIDGLRPAEQGEFTRRAFINHKLDLTEAEGLADLIDADTKEQKRQALRQMHGHLSQYYERLRTQIIGCLAHLEAYIDFPDEEIPEAVLIGLGDEIRNVQNTIHNALADDRRGERIRSGIQIVILGAPNAGKSSLLNALAKRDVAIVSYHAGTTRDIIEVHLDIAGYPVTLVDTAGLRESSDDIEQEGIRRARQRAGGADIKLVLFDGQSWPEKDAASAALLDNNSITIVSKRDLLQHALPDTLCISTTTGEGIDQLLNTLQQRIIDGFSVHDAPLITQARHRSLLAEAGKQLELALQDKALELKCEELRRAAQAIGKITGKIQVDDVLDVIFRQFCIGK